MTTLDSLLKAIFMRGICAIGTVLFASLATVPVRAESLIQSLPEDGAWVKFQARIVVNGNEDPTNSWTLKSVGQEQVEGQDCRWLEMEAKAGDQSLTILKVLIPVKEVGPGKNPFAASKRVWAKRGDAQPQQMASLQAADPVLAAILDGPVANVKKSDVKESIGYQDGNLECQVWTGSNEVGFANERLAIQHRLLKHEKVPFGNAGMSQELSLNAAGNKVEAKVTIRLEQFGKDAKSQLPDAR